MQNINTIELVKTNKDDLLEQLDTLLIQIEDQTDYSNFKLDLNSFHTKISHFSEQYSLTHFRFYGDTTQTDLKGKFDHNQSILPEIILRQSKLKKVLASSSFLSNLRSEFGDNMYYDIINSNFEINDKARDYMLAEQKLNQEVVEFKSQSKVKWEDSEIPVSKLYSLIKDGDRLRRKNAFDAIAKYHTANKEFFYTKLIELIKTRNRFAQELGFDSYVEYSLCRWNRIGYNYQDLKIYRDAVVEYFGETFKLLHDFKKTNLDIAPITYYDNNYFTDGFPQLVDKNGNKTIEKFATVLSKLSPNWCEKYQSMLDANSIDYIDRANKVNMGYATYIKTIDTPLIYSMFQNNDYDIRVLTHEFGHALQFILSWSGNPKKNLIEGTQDTVEIFSHSMEMLCLQDAELFFGKDADKYSILNYSGHLTTALSCALGDEFQETIYKLEDLSKDSIQTVYRTLQEKYTGNLFDSSENDYFINGDKWMEIDHFFGSPFYLVDYSLAIINALNIYKIYKQNPARGIEVWETLAKNLGNLNYQNITNLIPELRSPFDSNYIKETATFAKKEFADLLSNYLAAQPAS